MTGDDPAAPIRGAVTAALDAVEREERCLVLFAAESGSRAWGFPSPDSDWDVRFVYARPTDWHLSLRPRRDVIERALPGDLDLSGWDARKAVNLLLGGNVVLREWLRAPIIYRDVAEATDGLRRLIARLPARSAARHHYRSLALSIRARHLEGGDRIRLKKYFYAVRPALALRWLRQNAEGGPPMDLPSLLAGTTLDATERHELDALLRRKAAASELGEGSRLVALDAMIATEIALAETAAEPADAAHAAALADEAEALFRRCVALADRHLSGQAAA